MQARRVDERHVLRITVKFPHLTGSIPPNADEREQLLRWMDDLRSNGIAVGAHVRLFVQEFCDHVNSKDLNILIQHFASEDKTNRFLKWAEEEKEKAKTMFKQSPEEANRTEDRKFKRDLFIYVSNNLDAIVHLLVIIARCKKVDSHAYAELHLNTLTNISYYAKLYKSPTKMMVDKIRTVLEPKHILAWFKKEAQIHCEEYDYLIKRIEEYYEPTDYKRREIEAAACLFARGLVHCTDGPNSSRDLGDWYYHFLQALQSHGDCRMFPRFIDPNFADDLVRWEARKKSPDVTSDPMLMGDIISPEEMQEDGPPRTTRDQRDYLDQRKLESEVEYEPDNFDLRPYQNELVLHAKNGRNTIVCAPTGSGKTFIAVEIIKDHLEKMHRDGKVGRCAMLVPTVPLVDQQCLQLVTFLGHFRSKYRSELPYWIDAFSGCENGTEGRANRLLSTDICVMTPQILINMMNSVLRTEKLYFADFTLLIFDECHHCDKGHPYKILMEMLEKELPRMAERPQIVGLTASMGVGEGRAGWDMQACRNHMLCLCSNLLADSISTVRHQLDDLRNYVVPPVDHVIRVSRPQYNPFILEIDRVMFKIEAELADDLKKLISAGLTEDEIRFPSHDSPARYQTMVGTLKKNVNRVMDSNKRFLLVRSIDHLSHYFHAIVISDLLPNKYGLEYLEAKMDNYRKTASTNPIEEINNELLKYYSDIHPRLVQSSETENIRMKEILGKLYEELHNQFAKEPHSRCMIFVATRNCAQKLAEHLNQVPELPMFYQKNNIGFMVSSNQSGAAGGQSSQDQRRMREEFNSGKIKVLVVTSVAEEGLDIAACNLIIKYNNIGSERTMIQRRGRARQKNSRSVLLALDNSIEQSEFNNIRKEAMMMACIQHLQETSDTLLKNEIKQKWEEMKETQKELERREKEKRDRLKGRRYSLCCRSCGYKICQSSSIRSVADSIFTVVDPDVWKRSRFDYKINPTKDQLTTKIARWLCGNCGSQEWGTIVKYSNCWLPQLTAVNFTMDRLDSQTEYDQVLAASSEGSRRTWSQIQDQHFNIDPIKIENIRAMFTGLVEMKPDDAKMMDQQEYIANVKLVEKMNRKKNERKEKREYLQLDE